MPKICINIQFLCVQQFNIILITLIGVYDLQATIRNGQRCSTAKAYLVPAENRPNLDILKNAFARKV